MNKRRDIPMVNVLDVPNISGLWGEYPWLPFSEEGVTTGEFLQKTKTVTTTFKD
jgi:hypothetical protein